MNKFQTERVWNLWVHPYENSVEGEFVKFVTKTKYDKLLREFKKLQTQIRIWHSAHEEVSYDRLP